MDEERTYHQQNSIIFFKKLIDSNQNLSMTLRVEQSLFFCHDRSVPRCPQNVTVRQMDGLTDRQSQIIADF